MMSSVVLYHRLCYNGITDLRIFLLQALWVPSPPDLCFSVTTDLCSNVITDLFRKSPDFVAEVEGSQFEVPDAFLVT